MTKYHTSTNNQEFLNYVSKLKNNGALMELRLKQRLKCYGNPTNTMSHPVDKIKHWLEAASPKTNLMTLPEFLDLDKGEIC